MMLTQSSLVPFYAVIRYIDMLSVVCCGFVLLVAFCVASCLLCCLLPFVLPFVSSADRVKNVLEARIQC